VALLALALAVLDAQMLLYLAPVGLPLLLAIPMTVLSSQVDLGAALRAQRCLLIPEESRAPAVLRRAWQHARAQPA
jgi:membrane glycosyltransferase